MEQGKYIIRVCSSLTCHLSGSEDILRIIEEELGIKDGVTYPDKNFTLEVVFCLGMCDHSPSMMINETKYGDLTLSKVKKLIAELKG